MTIDTQILIKMNFLCAYLKNGKRLLINKSIIEKVVEIDYNTSIIMIDGASYHVSNNIDDIYYQLGEEMKRKENETFEDYKVRRREDNESTKEKLKGEFFWYSKNSRFYDSESKHLNRGTYVNKNV